MESTEQPQCLVDARFSPNEFAQLSEIGSALNQQPELQQTTNTVEEQTKQLLSYFYTYERTDENQALLSQGKVPLIKAPPPNKERFPDADKLNYTMTRGDFAMFTIEERERLSEAGHLPKSVKDITPQAVQILANEMCRHDANNANLPFAIVMAIAKHRLVKAFAATDPEAEELVRSKTRVVEIPANVFNEPTPSI